MRLLINTQLTTLIIMQKTITATLVVILFFSTSLEAQVLKRLGKRVSNRVERTISRKIEDKAAKKTEEVIDDILEGEEQKQKERQKTEQGGDKTSREGRDYTADSARMVNDILGGILGAQDVEVEDSYTFDFTATMEVKNGDDDAKINTVIQSYGDGAMLNKTGEDDGVIIMDWANEGAIMINEKEKTAQVMSLAWMEKMIEKSVAETEVDGEGAKIVKTGNAKTKNGYTCYEYIMEDEEAKVTTWFAPDVKFSYEDYLGGFVKMFGQRVNSLPIDQGYAMEMIMYDKKDKTTSVMEVVDISEKHITIDLGEYKVQNMLGN